MKLKIFTDGWSRGNPWIAWIWVYILDKNNTPLEKRYSYLGICTNNIAEYKAILFWVQRAIEMGWTQLDFYMDSKLAVSQLSWEWKIKNDWLKEIFSEIQDLVKKHKLKVHYTWIPREENKEADRLANKAMDLKN